MNINKKEYFMNKFKKVGLTALAGSLVAVSAHAGELTVTGGANVTYKWGHADSVNNTTGKAEPSVTLIDGNGEQIIGDVDYTSATVITVDFATAVAGSSILN